MRDPNSESVRATRPRRLLALLVGMATMVGAVVGATPSGAVVSPTPWSGRGSANPIDAQSSKLASVSCLTVTDCTAVGTYYPVSQSNAERPVIEHWNGYQWSLMTAATPRPGPGTSFIPRTSLTGVSCVSATFCMAVGWYSPPGGTVTPPAVTLGLSEVWNGSVWRIVTVPRTDSSFYDQLVGVSCTSAIRCEAVGIADPQSGVGTPVALSWNGGWRLSTQPAAPAGFEHDFSGVSCTVATCVIVGTSINADEGTSSTLIETGTTSLTGSSENRYGNLFSVSCTGPNACTAVGNEPTTDRTTDTGNAALVLTETNGSWTKSPITGDTTVGSSLHGVSCTSPGHCVAVGSRELQFPATSTVAFRDDGSGWSDDPTPRGSGDPVDLAGVSCVGPLACTAAGVFNQYTLVETDWTNVTYPTRIALACSPAPAVVKHPTRCVVAVRNSSPTTSALSPAGVVEFTTDQTGVFAPDAHCTLAATTRRGIASCAVSYTPSSRGTGRHTLTARYGGDDDFDPSTVNGVLAVRNPVPAVSIGNVSLDAATRVFVGVTCREATCRGTVALADGDGSAVYTLGAGRSKTVAVPLTARGRKALRHAGKRQPVKVAVSVTVTGGRTRSTTATLT